MKTEKFYTLIIAYTPNISKNGVDEEISFLKEMIKEFGGLPYKVDYLGIKNLAYPIKNQNSAHFVQFFFSFEISSELKTAISEINRKIGSNMHINTLRHIILVNDEENTDFEELKNFEGFDKHVKVL